MPGKVLKLGNPRSLKILQYPGYFFGRGILMLNVFCLKVGVMRSMDFQAPSPLLSCTYSTVTSIYYLLV